MFTNLTRWVGAGIIVAALNTGLAPADDSELKATTETSRNPITGTVTVKNTYKNKKKRVDGSKTSKETVQTKKYMTDGTVEAKKNTETSSQSAE